MPPRLILNADDFGLTPGINRAILNLHRASVLTSATLMANGPAFDDAVVTAESLPALGVGCHIVLVDGVPVLPSAEIPTLLGPDRRTFRPSLGTFVRDLLLHRVDPEEIVREAHAQILKLQVAGIGVTHVDTHKHTHIFPQVARAVLEAARQSGVRAIRNPFEPRWSTAISKNAGTPRLLSLYVSRRFEPSFHKLLQLGIEEPTTGGTLGMAATGTLDQGTLSNILSALCDGQDHATYELCCHPGYQDDALAAQNTRLRATREIEREALLTVIPKILSLPQPPELIHYGNLKQQPLP